MRKTFIAGVAATLLAGISGSAFAEQLTVFGPWLGPDQESVEAVLKVFADKSGHDVRYVGSDSFEQQIVVDLEAGSAPNVRLPAARPCLRHGQARLPDAAWRRCRRLGEGKLCRRPVLG